MKRWAAILGALSFLLGHDSFAGVSCSVPFNLTNGTTADASQVMANYNAILSCLLNNTAENGSNSSITSLSGLTTPLSLGQGGTPVFTAGTSAGTNTITATAVPTSFSLTLGYKIIFVAGGSNTAATTLNVSGTGAKSLFRLTPAGAVAMAGGEIVAGQVVEVVYDGTQYQMTSRPAIDGIPGMTFDYAGASGCPVGSLEAAGATTNLTATFPALSGVLSTTWGAPGGGAFALPDLRGRTTYSRDINASARITVAGGNFDGTAVGGVGGQQNKVITTAHMPPDPGHNHNANVQNTGNATTNPQNAFPAVPADASNIYSNGSNSTFNTGFITSATTGLSTGANNPLPVLSNAAIVLKCVKT